MAYALHSPLNNSIPSRLKKKQEWENEFEKNEDFFFVTTHFS